MGYRTHNPGRLANITPRFTLHRAPISRYITLVARLEGISLNDTDGKLQVDFERISVLYDNTKIGYIGIGAAALFFGFIIWELAAPGYALVWVSAVFLTYIPRVILSIQFARKCASEKLGPHNAGPWERYFFLASIVPFIVFSSAVIIPFGENSLIALLYYSIIVMTLLAGGILAYSTSLPSLFLFMSISVLPIVAKSLLVQELLFTVLGLTMLFGFVLLSKLIPRMHKLLLENISLKIMNQSQSLTDPLTKLGNRRRLRLRVEDLIPMSVRRKDPFSIILLDIDNFKEYNDEHGHNAGDAMLIKVAEILLECSREQDLVVRYGGEEFLLVLPSTDTEAAVVLTERIRTAMKDETDITVSAGLAMHLKDQGFDQLLERADHALYRAKQGGRDQYVLAHTV